MGKHYRAMRRTDYLDISTPCRIVILESHRGRVQLLVVSDDPPGIVQSGKRKKPQVDIAITPDSALEL